MARPQEKGLRYFPFDVDFFKDRKIRRLYKEYGSDGIMVYLYILCSTYGEDGYFLEADEFLSEDIGCELNMNKIKVGQIINYLCKRSLLDDTLLTSVKVLTSHGIQARFQEAIRSKAQKTPREVEAKYWLLEKSETESYVKVTQNPNYSENNPSYSEKNPHYSEKKDTKESKVKESKINKSKEDKSKSARKNGGYDEILSVVDDEDLKNLYYEFIKMRKLIKSPMTDRALATLIDKVNALEPSSIERQKKLLENSIVNNWKSVYPLKDNESKGSNTKPSKFNNYQTDSKTDYGELEEQILDMMLEEDYE